MSTEREGTKSPYFLIYCALLCLGVLVFVGEFMIASALDRVATAIERQSGR